MVVVVVVAGCGRGRGILAAAGVVAIVAAAVAIIPGHPALSRAYGRQCSRATVCRPKSLPIRFCCMWAPGVSALGRPWFSVKGQAHLGTIQYLYNSNLRLASFGGGDGNHLCSAFILLILMPLLAARVLSIARNMMLVLLTPIRSATFDCCSDGGDDNDDAGRDGDDGDDDHGDDGDDAMITIVVAGGGGGGGGCEKSTLF